MGIRFLHIPLDDMQGLGDRPAIFLAYLRLISRYADADGYVLRSGKQIKADLGYKRAIQEKCRQVLSEKGLLTFELASSRSPTIRYKVENGRNKHQG